MDEWTEVKKSERRKEGIPGYKKQNTELSSSMEDK